MGRLLSAVRSVFDSLFVLRIEVNPLRNIRFDLPLNEAAPGLSLVGDVPIAPCGDGSRIVVEDPVRLKAVFCPEGSRVNSNSISPYPACWKVVRSS